MSSGPPNNNNNNNHELILRYLSFASEINRNMSTIIHLTNNLRYNTFQLYNHHINNANFQINDLFFPPPFISPPPPADPPPASLRRRRRRTTAARSLPIRTLSANIFQNLDHVLSNVTQTQTPRRPTLMHVLRSTETNIYRDISTNHIMCPISQQQFVDADRVTIIRGCGHLFHADYIREWFQSSSHCPVCRYDIMTYTTERSRPRDASNGNPFRDVSGNPFQIDNSLNISPSTFFSLTSQR